MKKVFLFLITITLIVILPSCSLLTDKYTKYDISFVIPPNRSQEDSDRPLSYNVRVISSYGKEFFNDYCIEGDTITIHNLYPGKYKIIASGEEDIYSYNGSTDFEISPGETTEITLEIKLTDKNPETVTNLYAYPCNGSVILSWVNPPDRDFAKVVVTDGTNEQDVSGTAGAIGKYQFSNLTNDKSYTFSVKAVDQKNHESSVKTVTMSPCLDYKKGLTPLPIRMPPETPGTAGPDAEYVEFGLWPQNRVVDESHIQGKEGDPTKNINGWLCYTDGNGNYYIKMEAHPLSELNEVPITIKFDDGTTIENKTYYFELRPIKWRVITNNYTDASDKVKGKLLLSENIIDFCLYFPYDGTTDYNKTRNINGKSVYNNNYENSETRAFLNGLKYTDFTGEKNNYYEQGFLQKAFSAEAINKIEKTLLDNGEVSTSYYEKEVDTNEHICSNTLDKIFLLSLNECTRTTYGFSNIYDDYTEKPIRMKKTTDYSKARGVFSNYKTPPEDHYNYGTWYLRSPPSFDKNTVYAIDETGIVFNDNSNRAENVGGVVPALVIKF